MILKYQRKSEKSGTKFSNKHLAIIIQLNKKKLMGNFFLSTSSPFFTIVFFHYFIMYFVIVFQKKAMTHLSHSSFQPDKNFIFIVENQLNLINFLDSPWFTDPTQFKKKRLKKFDS